MIVLYLAGPIVGINFWRTLVNYPVERKLSSVNKTLLLLTVEHFHWRCASGVKSDIGHNQAAISWRASGNHQISLNASVDSPALALIALR